MKKILSFLMLMLCGIGLILAKPVNSNLARHVALNFLKSTEKKASNLKAEDLKDITSTTPFREFYIFSIKDNSGFILVSGDDCALPILGYSLDNPFVSKGMPEHIRSWFDNYESQIANIRWEGIEATDEISSQWQQLIEDSPLYTPSPVVGPLLTTKWDQSPYYNNKCPYHNGTVDCGSYNKSNDNTLTGCVATAMGQVMKYWNWPKTGHGSHSYNHATYGNINADFNYIYNWNNMPDSLSDETSVVENEAVSRLLYHIGVSVEMDYGLCISSAFGISFGDPTRFCAENALKDYFRYNSSTISGVQASNYTANDWIILLKNELNNARPILYQGYNSTTGGGHMFVCDGYNSSDQFHFNWGWGGNYNAYYAIGSLNPGSYSFNYNNYAIIGIQPDLPENIPTDGLIAYYPFNHNADDYSGNDNHGILQGNSHDPNITTDRFGNANSAYEFGGYDHPTGIRVPNSTSLQLGSSFSASFWIFQYEGNSMDGYGHKINRRFGCVICKDGDRGGLYTYSGDGTENNSFKVWFHNGNRIWDDNFGQYSTMSCFDNTKWMHYVVMIDSSHSSVYCNGVLIADSIQNQVANFNSANGKDLMIGLFGFGNWFPFYGKIDDIAIYNRALTADEVQSLYGGYVDQHEQCIYDTITTYGSLLWHGTLYTESGDYVYRTANGCDPVYHLHLIIIGNCDLFTDELPYLDNFDTYTTATNSRTGIEPSCWSLVHQDVPMEDDYKPMIWYNNACASSGSYSLILNKRGIYSMPRISTDISTLLLKFNLRQTQTKYMLQVGVMTDLSDISTFVPIKTINNESTGIESVTVNFSSYTGDGHYIVFHNILAPNYTGDYSCNYIDDLILQVKPLNCIIGMADLPYTDNFDNYTSSTIVKTSVEPRCWTLAHQDIFIAGEFKPMIYYAPSNAHSGNYSLILNKRCIYAMPYFDGDINSLQLSMYVKQPRTKYRMLVGVMSDVDDYTSFVPVAIINNSSTTIPVLHTIDFSSYSGTGHYIAFRNILEAGSTGEYSINYIDDLTLTLNCPGIAVTDLPYTDNFDTYTTSTTTKTGIRPPCWTLAHQDVPMIDEFMPMIYYASAHAHSGNYSLILNKRSIYALPKFNGEVNTLQLSMYLKQPQTKYQLQVGVLTDLGNPNSFTVVKTINNTSTAPVLVTVDFSSYSGNGQYIAFRNILASGQSGDYSINYIDDLSLDIRPEDCNTIQFSDLPYSDNFDSYTTSTNAKTGVEPPCWTLVQQDVPMIDEYKPMIYHGLSTANSGSYSLILNKRGIYAMPRYADNVNSLQLFFYLQQPQTKYKLQVGVLSDLGDPSTFTVIKTIKTSTTSFEPVTVDFSSYSGNGHYIAFRNILSSGRTGDHSLNYIDDLRLETRCSIYPDELPYTDNFDSYTTSTTTKTGVQPLCWTLVKQDVPMTDEYKPMVYYGSTTAHSGKYSLILNKRGIYAMPQYADDVNSLVLSMYLKQSHSKYQLQVGVLSDLNDPSTFTVVETINNSTTGFEHVAIDFASYPGNGHYIAFRNILSPWQTGDHSLNYIDDLTLGFGTVICPPIHIYELPYSDNFDSYTTSTNAKTGVQPPCWTLVHQDVPITDEFKHMIYYGSSTAHSGNYSLILNKRGIYAMPQYADNVNSLQLSFYLRQTQTKYQLQVGVLSSLTDGNTFVPIATIDNGSNTSTSVLHTVNFSSYSGNGQYIAFRNILASGQTGDYSCNYIDNITLSLTSAAMSKGDASINTFSTDKHFTIYPNPTTGMLTVEADEEMVRVDVFDYTGRCVASFERQTTVDLSRLAAGLYTLRVTLPERIEVRRVVKQ